jgi:hypothetical protein
VAGEQSVWARLTGIQFQTNEEQYRPGGRRQAGYTCQACAIYWHILSDRTSDDSPSFAELEHSAAETFARIASRHGCPHWEKYQRLRANPAVRAAVRVIAEAEANEGTVDAPPGDGDRQPIG